jgi:hypothetical protein
MEDRLLAYILPLLERWRRRVDRIYRMEAERERMTGEGGGMVRFSSLESDVMRRSEEVIREQRMEREEEEEGGRRAERDRELQASFDAAEMSEVVFAPPIPPRPRTQRRSYEVGTRNLRRRQVVLETLRDQARS